MSRRQARTVSWSGQPAFGSGWALFRGCTSDNAPHAHAALQLSVAETGTVAVRDGEGMLVRGAAVVVRPLVEHTLEASGAVTLLYLEPQCPQAFQLLHHAHPEDVSVIDAQAVLGVGAGLALDVWIDRLTSFAKEFSSRIDPRLRAALDLLAEEPGALSIGGAADRCGLSDSHLRLLAGNALGLPLSTWLVWRKLERAGRALSEGETLAAASATAGFADQSHLTRSMRRMFGVTPRTAQRAVTSVGER